MAAFWTISNPRRPETTRAHACNGSLRVEAGPPDELVDRVVASDVLSDGQGAAGPVEQACAVQPPGLGEQGLARPERVGKAHQQPDGPRNRGRQRCRALLDLVESRPSTDPASRRDGEQAALVLQIDDARGMDGHRVEPLRLRSPGSGRAVAHAADGALVRHDALDSRNPAASSKSLPGVRMVTPTVCGSWPGPATRISSGSSLTRLSGLRSRPCVRTAVTCTGTSRRGRAAAGTVTALPARHSPPPTGRPVGGLRRRSSIRFGRASSRAIRAAHPRRRRQRVAVYRIA
jgi:hypothetical protein